MTRHIPANPEVPAARIAERAGVSPSTAVAAVKRLESGLVVPAADGAEPVPVRIFTRTVRWAKDVPDPETGLKRDIKQAFYQRVNADLAGDMRTLARATRVDTRNHGGRPDRNGCPDHPDAPVILRTTRHCSTCNKALDIVSERPESPVSIGKQQDADLLQPDTRPAAAGVKTQDADLLPTVATSLRMVNLGTYHNDTYRPHGQPLASDAAERGAAARADLLARKERRSAPSVARDEPPQRAVPLPNMPPPEAPPVDQWTG